MIDVWDIHVYSWEKLLGHCDGCSHLGRVVMRSCVDQVVLLLGMSVRDCLDLLAEGCSRMVRPMGVRGLRNRVKFWDQEGE